MFGCVEDGIGGGRAQKILVFSLVVAGNTKRGRSSPNHQNLAGDNKGTKLLFEVQLYNRKLMEAELSAGVGFRSYDSSDKSSVTLQLTIYPHQNNAIGVSSLSITEYTDRQLTSALGTRREKCLCRRNCFAG